MTGTKPKDDYDVGYARPPVEHQFKKGQPSRNPRGRPRTGSQGKAVDVKELLNERVTITIDGKRSRVPFNKAFIQMVKAKALQGDTKAMQMIFTLIREQETVPPVDEPAPEKKPTTRTLEDDPLRESILAWREVSRRYEEARKGDQRPSTGPEPSP